MSTPDFPPAPMAISSDSLCTLFAGGDGRLRDALMRLPGIPPVTYRVHEDGQVFVFDKFVRDVKRFHEQDCRQGLNRPLEVLASIALPMAFLSASEVVSAWGIVPRPYRICQEASGGAFLLHGPFEARLPPIYSTKADLEQALSVLLIGGTLPGVGDFTYRMQPMSLMRPLDTGVLPRRPVIEPWMSPLRQRPTQLGEMVYHPGFDPVSRALFGRLQQLESEWVHDSARAREDAESRAYDLWARTSTLSLETLVQSTDVLRAQNQEKGAQVRYAYPDLPKISDAALLRLFGAYQLACHHTYRWTACREDAFLFYLMGRVAAPEAVGAAAERVGAWAGYALLRGDSVEQAFAFGRAAWQYDEALSDLTRRVSNALRFVAQDQDLTSLEGPSVMSVCDFYRASSASSERKPRETLF